MATWWVWGYVGCGLLPALRQGRRGFSALLLGALGSGVILVLSVLVLDGLHLRLTTGSWFVTSLLLSIGFSLCPRVARPISVRDQVKAVHSSADWLAWAALALGLLFIFYRTCFQPLTGADTNFRWDFLARQMVTLQGIDFYPAASGTDFGRYFWPEGIPPMVSCYFAWSYVGRGTFNPVLTAPAVLWATALVFLLVWKLAARGGGPRAGLWACALLASSSLHSWSVSLGQETALITVGLLALVWAFDPAREDGLDWLGAALGVSVVALARDYGVAAIALGAVFLAARQTPNRAGLIGRFLLLTLVFTAPWYLRTWWRTGNPFYAQDILGLFRVNPMHLGLMRYYHAQLNFSDHWLDRLAQVGRSSWGVGPAVILGGGLALLARTAWQREAKIIAVAWIAIWLWSISYTAGGLLYSERVLAPVLAVCATAGGIALLRWARGGRLWLVGVLVLAMTADASLRMLVIRDPFSVPIKRWFKIADSLSAYRGDGTYEVLAKKIGMSRVVVDSAYDFSSLTEYGIAVVPPWSPEFAFLQSPTLSPEAASRQLQSLGIDYLLLAISPDLRAYFRRYPIYRDLSKSARPALASDKWILFRLETANSNPRP